MTDLWSFLLQTLNASGAAALLLAIKALFRDKLSPRWQFGIWGLLALVLLLPAGAGGRYVLFPWPLWVEAAKTALTGDYALTQVLAPVPLLRGLGAPESLWEFLYLLYLAGVVLLLGWYILTYLRLRLTLRRGRPAGEEQVRRVAAAYGLSPCRAVAVPGLPTAFVCGVVRPVLALPAGVEVDDKVVLHELLHFRHRDAAWGLLICLFRCIHWCNPLLWYCADRAGNDAEALCDQRVLERLEGEDRRDYGRILLSAASEQYARAPGTSSLSNGGRNIRARIQAIARFKRYPAGMALVSVCIAVVLGLPLVLGRAQALAPAAGLDHDDQAGFCLAMASARLTPCTTLAGALDAYGKAVLGANGIYRALCAPLADHPALAAEMEAAAAGPDHWVHEHWESGLPGGPDGAAGRALGGPPPGRLLGGGYPDPLQQRLRLELGGRWPPGGGLPGGGGGLRPGGGPPDHLGHRQHGGDRHLLVLRPLHLLRHRAQAPCPVRRGERHGPGHPLLHRPGGAPGGGSACVRLPGPPGPGGGRGGVAPGFPVDRLQ